MNKTRDTCYRTAAALAFAAAASCFAAGAIAVSPLLMLAGAGNLVLGVVLLRTLGLCREPRRLPARATCAETSRE